MKPLPALHDFANLASFAGAHKLDALPTHWRNPGDQSFWLSRSAWSLQILASAVTQQRNRPVVVAVPDFICDPFLWPLRAMGAVLKFYAVDSQARPDWNAIRQSDLTCDLFLLPHYFGHPNDAAAARSFCDDRGALLVEDAAHALGPCEGIGELGDLVFYSPWKFFQIPNGAVLVVRPRARDWLAALQEARSQLGARSSLGAQWLKRSLQSQLRTDRPAAPKADDFFVDSVTHPMPQHPVASPLAAPILCAQDLEECGRRRTANDLAVRNFFEGREGWAPLSRTPAAGPLHSVFRLDSEERIRDAYVRLRAAGVEAGGWPPMPPEVSAARSEAGRLRRTLINLPCHQGLTPQILLRALRQAFPAEGPQT